jgi:3-hydroxyacyl-CoA dehydrogenase
MLNIKKVTVIGANGTMGATVAGLVAAFTGAEVYLICRKIEAAQKAVDVAANSVKADSIRGRLIPKTYDDFEACIADSDWVFESVAEDTAIKSEIYKRISKCRKPHTIITTGTSGFSINELGKDFDEQSRKYYFGTHFFNPPYSLTLCEVIRSKDTDAQLCEEMKAYLKDILFRDVIETTDTPAFLGNRIGFHFLNKALQYAEKYKQEGGIDYIDSILGPFTGRGMTPIVTVDFVGLDVHKAIVDNLFAKSSDYDHAVFQLPDFVTKLIAEGKLGRKSRDGLFKIITNEDKSKQSLVYDIASESLRPVKKYALPFAKNMVAQLKVGNYENAMKILKNDTSKEGLLCKHFMVSYITYSLVVAQVVATQITDADIAMSTGFNWIGPCALMEAFGGFAEVLEMARTVDFENNLVQQLQGIDNENKKPLVSPFDYRKFFRAQL